MSPFVIRLSIWSLVDILVLNWVLRTKINARLRPQRLLRKLRLILTVHVLFLLLLKQRQKAFADRKRVEQTYAVGDQMLLSTKNMMLKHAEQSRKLMPKWVGPVEIVQKVGNLVYELKMNPGRRIHPVFHVSLLKPYKFDGRIQPPPHQIELEGHLEYEVDCILDHRFSDMKRQKLSYSIPWKVYGPEHNSWEPEANVANASDLIGEY
jgi:hypothetical protein